MLWLLYVFSFLLLVGWLFHYLLFSISLQIYALFLKWQRKRKKITLYFLKGQGTLGSGDRYLNHLYTIEKWHVQQERIQIAESITLY